MATKAELLEELKRKEQYIELLQQKNNELYRQIDEMLPDDHPKLRSLKIQLERAQEMYKQSEINREAAIKRADRLQTQLAELSRKEAGRGKPGRKPADRETIDQIMALHESGKSTRAIAGEMGLSKSAVARYVSQNKTGQ